MKTTSGSSINSRRTRLSRRQEVVDGALRLFAERGYDAVSLTAVAESLGVQRTQLYRWFRNKREVFDAAIILITERLSAKLTEIRAATPSSAERLRRLCFAAAAIFIDNRPFLIAIVDFVTSQLRAGHDMARRMDRFTVGFKRALRTLVFQGVRSGEFRSDLSVRLATELLFSQFESIALKSATDRSLSLSDLTDRIDLLIESFATR